MVRNTLTISDLQDMDLPLPGVPSFRGGKNGLEPIEKTVIDRAVQVIYRPYLADPNPEKNDLGLAGHGLAAAGRTQL